MHLFEELLLALQLAFLQSTLFDSDLEPLNPAHLDPFFSAEKISDEKDDIHHAQCK